MKSDLFLVPEFKMEQTLPLRLPAPKKSLLRVSASDADTRPQKNDGVLHIGRLTDEIKAATQYARAMSRVHLAVWVVEESAGISQQPLQATQVSTSTGSVLTVHVKCVGRIACRVLRLDGRTEMLSPSASTVLGLHDAVEVGERFPFRLFYCPEGTRIPSTPTALLQTVVAGFLPLLRTGTPGAQVAPPYQGNLFKDSASASAPDLSFPLPSGPPAVSPEKGGAYPEPLPGPIIHSAVAGSKRPRHRITCTKSESCSQDGGEEVIIVAPLSNKQRVEHSAPAPLLSMPMAPPQAGSLSTTPPPASTMEASQFNFDGALEALEQSETTTGGGVGGLFGGGGFGVQPPQVPQSLVKEGGGGLVGSGEDDPTTPLLPPPSRSTSDVRSMRRAGTGTGSGEGFGNGIAALCHLQSRMFSTGGLDPRSTSTTTTAAPAQMIAESQVVGLDGLE